MPTLQALREKNPSVPFYCISDPEFRRFGRVIHFDASALIAECEKAAVMPESGSRYVPDMPELEALLDFETVKHALRGEGSCQMGVCWGYNRKLNCLEYHRASEHNIAVSDLVLLLASQQDMQGFDLPVERVSAFFVPKGATIEVYATTLHFCPCQVMDEGFRCIIILPRGANHPLQKPRPTLGDGRLLWAKDKWLIAHPDNADVVKRGAYAGLMGENIEIKY